MVYGSIYFIKHKIEDIYYIGSTRCKISERWTHHKNCYKSWKKTGKRYCTIFSQFEKYGGTDQFYCQKIKSFFDLPDLETLLNIEQYYIDEYKKNYICVNKNIAFHEYRDVKNWL
jgi:hypothetical protein